MKAKKEENKKSRKRGDSETKTRNELSEPRWSVITFEDCAAGSLTYEQATRKSAELAARKVSGLCIITDEAAARIYKK